MAETDLKTGTVHTGDEPEKSVQYMPKMNLKIGEVHTVDVSAGLHS